MNVSPALFDALTQAGWTPPAPVDHKYGRMGWFKIQRMEFITRTLAKEGVIYRHDLTARFRISIPQATMDIAEWQAINHKLGYKVRTKSYERNHHMQEQL